MRNGVIVIKIRNNEKNKTTSNKQIAIEQSYNKFLASSLIKNKDFENRRIRKKTNLEGFSKHDNNKIDRLRLTYRICRSRKAQILKANCSVHDSTIDLIDRFRAILNSMLEDENGAYPMEEILNVSRELDDVIYFYYKISEQEKNG
jgi:hypothetical protein